MTQEVVDRLLDPIQSGLFTMDPGHAFIFWCHSGSPRRPWKTPNFQACFQGRKTLKTCSQGLQKTSKIDPRITNKRFLRKHGFCNTFLAKTLFSELQLSIIPLKIDAKSDLDTSSKKTQNLTHQNSKSSQNGVPKSSQNHWKSCFGPPRVLPAAPMVPQGVPKLTKWSPGW